MSAFDKQLKAALFSPERAAALAKKRKEKAANRESKIEADGRERVAEGGGHSYKFKSPGHNAVPDQIELYGVEPMMKVMASMACRVTRSMAVEILAAAVRFTEYKQPGEPPKSPQEREHERLRARGFTVNVIDRRTK